MSYVIKEFFKLPLIMQVLFVVFVLVALLICFANDKIVERQAKTSFENNNVPDGKKSKTNKPLLVLVIVIQLLVIGFLVTVSIYMIESLIFTIPTSIFIGMKLITNVFRVMTPSLNESHK